MTQRCEVFISQRLHVFQQNYYNFAAKWCLGGVFEQAVFKNQMPMTVITFALSISLEMPDI